MESIKVGNKDFMPDGRKLSSRHLVLTEGLLTECSQRVCPPVSAGNAFMYIKANNIGESLYRRK